MASIKNQLQPIKSFSFQQLNKSKGILDDHSVRKSMNSREGSITKTPTADIDIANKKYVDDNATSPGGGNGEVQFNDAGTFDGDSTFIYRKTQGRLHVELISLGVSGVSTYETPAADGTANQIIKTNGSGALSWIDLPAAGVTNHSALNELDYANAAHTGFEPAKGADDNYVTDAEKVIIGNTSNTNTGDNTTHADGDGSDHADVALHNTNLIQLQEALLTLD